MRILLIFLVGLCTTFGISGQNKKAEKEAAGLILFEKAAAAIEAKDFVIIVDTYESSGGTFETNTDVAIFFSHESDFAFMQGWIVAGNNYTNKVNVTDYSKETDKKGNIKVAMQVKGAFVTAKVEVFLKKGGNYADVIIYPAKGDSRRFSGEVTLRGESKYFKRPGEV